MSIEEFRDDDAGYLSWVAANPGGYVINIQRSLNRSDARLHRANCYTISGHPPRGKTWTGPYIKRCSIQIRELDQWSAGRFGAPITRCGVCHPPRM